VEKILQDIWKAIQKFFLQKQFVYRYDYYDGTEKSLEVYETNVVQYEFVNQGQTVCVINGMELNPSQPFTPGITEIPPTRWKGIVNYNEKDVTVYKYRFIPIPIVCSGSITVVGWFLTNPICSFDFTFFINGIAINNTFTQTGSEPPATMEGSLIGNIIPANFSGTIVASQVGDDLV